jgi:GT2 family glycosyltransferase/peptidoglycan/xylan/chitin deacetylase (PgdA/CDA1 family)
VIEISVIIPTFNRAADLSRCLAALARQTAAPERFEVVVIDDGSTDATPELLASYQPPFRLRVEHQPNAGQAAALNRAVALADARLCLFLDDDIVADPSLVGEHLRGQELEGGVVALGMLGLRLVGRRGWLPRQVAAWWRHHYERLQSGALVPDFRACYSGNLSVPTEAVRRVGGFDESLPRSFDVELAYRLVQAGLRIVFLPRASAVQNYSRGFRAIIRDFDRTGTAAVALHRRHPELLGHTPLGDFSQGTFRTVALRRALLALRVPVWPLRIIDRVAPSRSWPRLFAALQLHCFWRSVRRTLADSEDWRRLTRGTVVLMYHALGRPEEEASRYVLPARRFRRQLRWLRLLRYPIISLDEYARSRGAGTLPAARAVVITFDDGYADSVDLGLPLLRKTDVPAIVFVVSGSVDDANRWTAAPPLGGRRLLTWEQLGDLHEAGFAVGAHTVSHPRLTDLDDAEVERELGDSRAELESRLGAPVVHFAYPYGKSSPQAERLAREAGYVTACGVQPGANGGAVALHNLRRVEVEGTWSLPRFALTVWAGHPLRLARGR